MWRNASAGYSVCYEAPIVIEPEKKMYYTSSSWDFSTRQVAFGRGILRTEHICIFDTSLSKVENAF